MVVDTAEAAVAMVSLRIATVATVAMAAAAVTVTVMVMVTDMVTVVGVGIIADATDMAGRITRNLTTDGTTSREAEVTEVHAALADIGEEEIEMTMTTVSTYSQHVAKASELSIGIIPSLRREREILTSMSQL